MAGRIAIRLPSDPAAAWAIRAWAAQKGLEQQYRWVEPRKAAPQFPYTCRHGHLIASAQDLKFRRRSDGRERSDCLVCHRELQRKNKANARAARKVSA